MKIDQIPGIAGVLLGTPTVFDDPRGSFAEIFRESHFADHFVQGNHSRSKAGVLRGLHYHEHQADAWYVIGGHAQAMLADLRQKSEPPPVVAVELNAALPQVLYIPPGVAHGFYAVTDVDLIYWVTNYYDATDEKGIAWDDPTLNAP